MAISGNPIKEIARRRHAGDGMVRHPNLDEAVVTFRASMSGDHRIYYSPVINDPLPALRRHFLESLAGEGGAEADVARVKLTKRGMVEFMQRCLDLNR